jgi:hypothetical protein
VVLGTQAQANGYRLSLTHEGQTYTTALIAGNATQAQIQAAVDAGFAVAGARWTVVLGQVGTPQEDTFTLSAGGSLAGSNLNLVSLQTHNASGSGTPVTRTFVVGNSASNITNLKSAYAQLLNGHEGLTVAANDIDVSFSRTSAGERYVVNFVGALAGTDIDPKGIGVVGTGVDYSLLRNGAAPVTEVQRVAVDRQAGTNGSFILRLSHGGQSYETAAIDFGATAAQLQAALRAAGTPLAGVSVSAEGTDAYLVSFAGALAGQNVAELEVAAVEVDAQLPQGSFQISFDDEGTRRYSPAIAYSANDEQLKANVQTAMNTLFGAGNVTVALDAA